MLHIYIYIYTHICLLCIYIYICIYVYTYTVHLSLSLSLGILRKSYAITYQAEVPGATQPLEEILCRKLLRSEMGVPTLDSKRDLTTLSSVAGVSSSAYVY